MPLLIELVPNVKAEGQIWRSPSQVQKGAQVHRFPDVGCTSKPPLGTRRLWRAENWERRRGQSWPSPTGRINQWLFGSESQSSISVWLSQSTEQTLAACKSHLGSHQLKQAWPRLRLISLGLKKFCLPRPGCGKQESLPWDPAGLS